MREIKFRFWDKVVKKMLKAETISWELNMIGYKEKNLSGIAPLNAVTLMQFTGLLDKSGVEIWESDILESNDKLRKYKVVYNNNAGAWYLEGLGEAWCDPIPRWDSFEVNGNIYENGDLIK